jgi:hypothetical protein
LVHHLTVATVHDTAVSEHADHATAYARLLQIAVSENYYLHTVTATPARTTYELLQPVADRRQPFLAGHAAIEATPRPARRNQARSAAPTTCGPSRTVTP